MFITNYGNERIGHINELVSYVVRNEKGIAERMRTVNEALDATFFNIAPAASTQQEQNIAPQEASLITWIGYLKGYGEQVKNLSARWVDFGAFFKRVQAGTSSLVQNFPYMTAAADSQVQAQLNKPHFWIYKIVHILAELPEQRQLFSIQLLDLLKGKRWQEVLSGQESTDAFCLTLQYFNPTHKQLLREALYQYVRITVSSQADMQATNYGDPARSRDAIERLISMAVSNDILLIKKDSSLFNSLDTQAKRIYLNCCCVALMMDFYESPSNFINKAFLSGGLFSE